MQHSHDEQEVERFCERVVEVANRKADFAKFTTEDVDLSYVPQGYLVGLFLGTQPLVEIIDTTYQLAYEKLIEKIEKEGIVGA